MDAAQAPVPAAGAAGSTGPAAAGTALALLAQLADTSVAADPYPVYARLRTLGPAHRSAAGIIYLTRYAECAAIVRDTGFLVQSPAWNDQALPGWRDRPALVATFETMLFRDPPEHTRLRRLVSAAFTPRQAERMRAQVRHAVTATLGRLADAGADGSPVDLQEILATSLPIAVIAGIVGVPRSDWPILQTAITALLQVVELTATKEQLAAADDAADGLREYFAGLAARRRRAPADDLASALVAAADGVSDGVADGAADGAAAAGSGARAGGGPGCTEAELLQTMAFIFMAGVDTMTNLLANGTVAFLAHPAQADLLRADPGRSAAAVEEVLRYDAPVQFTGRVAAADTTIGGTAIGAGRLVVAAIGAANRDPDRFRDPDSFDITRAGSTVLSFGGGIHYCLGAPLARVQAGIYFEELLTRFPALRLAGQPVRQGLVFRGFSELPVAVR